MPRNIRGSLDLRSLRSAQDLQLPRVVGGLTTSVFNLGSQTTAVGLVLPDIMEGRLILSGLQSANGLNLPRVFNGTLYLSESKFNPRTYVRADGGRITWSDD